MTTLAGLVLHWIEGIELVLSRHDDLRRAGLSRRSSLFATYIFNDEQQVPS
ncbi:MAG: hypothetical protein JW846_04435 [Dehalococcoidia bacterium]|nr:hypothetical protein [Dehalococcoidia bacterium]